MSLIPEFENSPWAAMEREAAVQLTLGSANTDEWQLDTPEKIVAAVREYKDSNESTGAELRRKKAMEAVAQLAEMKRNKAELIEQLLQDRVATLAKCKEDVAEITAALYDLGYRRPRAAVDPNKPKTVKRKRRTRQPNAERSV